MLCSDVLTDRLSIVDNRDLKTHVDMLETSGKVGTFADVLRDTMAEVRH